MITLLQSQPNFPAGNFQPTVTQDVAESRADELRRVWPNTSEKEAPRYYNPYTNRFENEEELWASCGNWDL